ncbi:hypothetical protein DPMN_060214 [Dreissena polymorpha]|uniref:Uncharacterized protein n=1 Tax=Dreissena polymorpha TaxID=45954 RepID=A0A9D4HHY7_DREPO|nr:hypothetical protein DPMN_060214 [Dreissena polymorpha]
MEVLLDTNDKENTEEISIYQMGLVLQRLFCVQPKRKIFAGKMAHYQLKWITNSNAAADFNYETFESALPPGFIITKKSLQCIEVLYETEFSINKNKVNKVIIFNDNKFSVILKGQEVHLQKLRISKTYTCSKNEIYNVCMAVKAIPICEGFEFEKKKLKFKANYTVEYLQNGNNTKRVIRSQCCKSVLPFTFIKQPTCKSCTRQRLSYIEPPIQKSEEEKIRELMSSATDAMITLIMSQVSDCKLSNTNQNRWERTIVNECMNWYIRSPLSYIQMRQSGLLLLPSPSMLILYKNSFSHSPGLSRDIFAGWTKKPIE